MSQVSKPGRCFPASADRAGHETSPDAPGLSQIAAALPGSLRDCFPETPALPSREESVFRKQDDYWSIAWQGHRAHLKCTRGLHCLALLLRHPGREFHVSELRAHEIAPRAARASNRLRCKR